MFKKLSEIGKFKGVRAILCIEKGFQLEKILIFYRSLGVSNCAIDVVKNWRTLPQIRNHKEPNILKHIFPFPGHSAPSRRSSLAECSGERGGLLSDSSPKSKNKTSDNNGRKAHKVNENHCGSNVGTEGDVQDGGNKKVCKN